jgi:SUMO ligase MMS21 Smc5/6 complex component
MNVNKKASCGKHEAGETDTTAEVNLSLFESYPKIDANSREKSVLRKLSSKYNGLVNRYFDANCDDDPIAIEYLADELNRVELLLTAANVSKHVRDEIERIDDLLQNSHTGETTTFQIPTIYESENVTEELARLKKKNHKMIKKVWGVYR